jgi:hypothetical protein
MDEERIKQAVLLSLRILNSFLTHSLSKIPLVFAGLRGRLFSADSLKKIRTFLHKEMFSRIDTVFSA